MKTIILGTGVQGKKRRPIIGKDFVAFVDPVDKNAHYKNAFEVPLDSFDNVMLCVPDTEKVELIKYFLKNKKNILVEKPLIPLNISDLLKFKKNAEKNKVTIYTAYNHRFEPNIKKMRDLIKSEKLGRIFNARLFYGNGTAKLVKNSYWRDKQEGVLHDLGSHLLDMINFWFGVEKRNFRVVSANKFENKAFDHVILHSDNKIDVTLEMSLLCWKNSFYVDIFGEKGSAHIRSLCKWGPSYFKFNKRKYPSGIPDQMTDILVRSDPTWKDEYRHFKKMCSLSINNLSNDIHIFKTLNSLKN